MIRRCESCTKKCLSVQLVFLIVVFLQGTVDVTGSVAALVLPGFLCSRRTPGCSHGLPYSKMYIPATFFTFFFSSIRFVCPRDACRVCHHVCSVGHSASSCENRCGQTTVNNCAPKHYITPINVMPYSYL